MAKYVEKTGKSIDEAITLAIEEMDVKREDVDIEIIDEGNKGLFGLLGSKQAKVKVSIKQKECNKAKSFLEEVFKKMDLDVDIIINETEDEIDIDLQGKNMGVIIGRRGETLDALQYLTSIIANKGQVKYKKVLIDTENYRKKREETLVILANRIAERAITMKKSITMEPMNPYERRIIHSTLQNNKYIETYSVGDEPNRKVVIALK
ncbi:MAG: RNA-binding cell elongation regulator Jag/EloR [Deltaproteobacteria bacterium]